MGDYLCGKQLTSSGADGAAIETQAVVFGSIDTLLAESIHRTGGCLDVMAIGADWELLARI